MFHILNTKQQFTLTCTPLTVIFTFKVHLWLSDALRFWLRLTGPMSVITDPSTVSQCDTICALPSFQYTRA